MIDNTIISISIILLASFVFILSMKGKLFGGYNNNALWLWTTFILFIINDLTVKLLALNSNNEEE